MTKLAWVIGLILLLLLCGWVVQRMSQGPASEQPAPNAPVVIDDAAVAIDEAPLTMTQAQTLKAHSIALLENSWESDRQQLSLKKPMQVSCDLPNNSPPIPGTTESVCHSVGAAQTDRP
ncbi:MAG: hypothetical protein R3C56_33860 [Pirellulaceae bacterium]